MKELSIEEKAKAYDEALEKASKLRVQNPFDTVSQMMEYVFPELKEVEDEKIRKELIDYLIWLRNFREGDYAPAGKYDINTMIAWLENQKTSEEALQYLRENHSPAQVSDFQAAMNIAVAKAYDKGYNDGLEKQVKKEYVLKSSNKEDVLKLMERIKKLGENYDLNLPNRSYDIYAVAKDILYWLEKQGEQKPVDKAEPKFKEGDWVVSEDGKTWLINGIDSKNYQVISIDGEHSYFPIIKQSSMHLWSIDDAKAGDVLASKDGDDILIFRNLDSNTHFSSYNNIRGKSELNWANSRFVPATKEQRESLEKAISDAGYKWDADKKVLKKIEQNPAWSEDDERYMIDIIAMLKSDISGSDDLQNWFESIKDRMTSKRQTSINNLIANYINGE